MKDKFDFFFYKDFGKRKNNKNFQIYLNLDRID